MNARGFHNIAGIPRTGPPLHGFLLGRVRRPPRLNTAYLAPASQMDVIPTTRWPRSLHPGTDGARRCHPGPLHSLRLNHTTWCSGVVWIIQTSFCFCFILCFVLFCFQLQQNLWLCDPLTPPHTLFFLQRHTHISQVRLERTMTIQAAVARIVELQ